MAAKSGDGPSIDQRSLPAENRGMADAFGHSRWATGELLHACAGLEPDLLHKSVTGSYGSILETFNHLVLADGGYVRRLVGFAPAWVIENDDRADLKVLAVRLDQVAALWDRFLSKPIDAGRIILLDDETYEAEAGIVIGQALHHATAHREQICCILTNLGRRPPNIEVWTYGEVVGRGTERRPKAPG